MLPDSHPAKIALDQIPFPLNAFSDEQSSFQNGFINKNFSGAQQRKWSILVVSHPLLEGYLVKTYKVSRGDNHYSMALPRYLQRIAFADEIRKKIHAHRFIHLNVPKKWLYKLPDYFKDGKAPYGKFLLIVEDMHILQKKQENLFHFYHMPEDHLLELLTLLSGIKKYDIALQNLPFTMNNQIVFIDTEPAKESWEYLCLVQLIPFLNPELQSIAKSYCPVIPKQFQN